jgi:aspartyl-tRNA(Asn)/glutamyl-tRNA(Gln) amidotransferase subunit A
MAGHDEKDSTSINHDKEDYLVNLDQSVKGLRIGVPKEFFEEGLDGQVQQVIEDALNTYKKMGAELIDISLPNTHLAIPVYYVIAPAEASSNLSRYDGVRYGYRAKEYDDLMDMYFKTRQQGFGEEVKRRILIGTYVLSAGYYDAYYLKAQKIRQLISNDFKKAFQQCDVIMGPSAPSVAFKANEKKSDPLAMYLQDIYTISTNLAGLPGMSIPAGMVNNLPVGLQLIGNYFKESQMLNVAHAFQQETDWHQKVPKGVI